MLCIVDKKAPVQKFIFFLTLGIGLLIGNFVCQQIIGSFGNDKRGNTVQLGCNMGNHNNHVVSNITGICIAFFK